MTGSSAAAFRRLQQWLDAHIIGQSRLVQRLLITLLADGHLLVEGAPGLAKTRAIKALASGLEGSFHRIQFTPDLLPGDLTGSDILLPGESRFQFQQGPIFHHLILADEVNRAPAKVQSALLEAMAERQVSVGQHSYPLPELFLVMATQNPLEQEGTYPLPEAQLDRFLMQVMVGHPDTEAERLILRQARQEAGRPMAPPPVPLTQDEVFDARRQVLELYLAPAVEDYLIDLVMATRQPAQLDEELAEWIDFGVSPRATIALDRCARARAWLAGRDHVTPDDVQEVMPDVFRHRLLLSYEAEAAGIHPDRVIARLLERVALA